MPTRCDRRTFYDNRHRISRNRCVGVWIKQGTSWVALAPFRDKIPLYGLTCHFCALPKNAVTLCEVPRSSLSTYIFSQVTFLPWNKTLWHLISLLVSYVWLFSLTTGWRRLSLNVRWGFFAIDLASSTVIVTMGTPFLPWSAWSC